MYGWRHAFSNFPNTVIKFFGTENGRIVFYLSFHFDYVVHLLGGAYVVVHLLIEEMSNLWNAHCFWGRYITNVAVDGAVQEPVPEVLEPVSSPRISQPSLQVRKLFGKAVIPSQAPSSQDSTSLY